MHNFGRLVTRWEYYIENFLGFVRLACLHILLRNILAKAGSFKSAVNQADASGRLG